MNSLHYTIEVTDSLLNLTPGFSFLRLTAHLFALAPTNLRLFVFPLIRSQVF